MVRIISGPQIGTKHGLPWEMEHRGDDLGRPEGRRGPRAGAVHAEPADSAGQGIHRQPHGRCAHSLCGGGGGGGGGGCVKKSSCVCVLSPFLLLKERVTKAVTALGFECQVEQIVGFSMHRLRRTNWWWSQCGGGVEK